MNSKTQIYPTLSESPHLRLCRTVMVFLAVPSILVVIWLFRIGFDPVHYWQTQVNGFVYLNDLFSGQPLLWHNLTQLGDAYLLLPLLSFFILYRPVVWVALFAAIPLTTLLVHGGKALAAVPRPAAVLDPTVINIIGKSLTGHNSLPSGHTATVFVATTVIALVIYPSLRGLSRWVILTFLLSIALLLGISRVVVGAHWPLDIYFGALCGFFGGASGVYLTQQYSYWWVWITQLKGKLILGVIMLLWSVSLLPPLHDSATVSTVAQWIASVIGIVVASQLVVRYVLSKERTAAILDGLRK